MRARQEEVAQLLVARGLSGPLADLTAAVLEIHPKLDIVDGPFDARTTDMLFRALMPCIMAMAPNDPSGRHIIIGRQNRKLHVLITSMKLRKRVAHSLPILQRWQTHDAQSQDQSFVGLGTIGERSIVGGADLHAAHRRLNDRSLGVLYIKTKGARVYMLEKPSAVGVVLRVSGTYAQINISQSGGTLAEFVPVSSCALVVKDGAWDAIINGNGVAAGWVLHEGAATAATRTVLQTGLQQLLGQDPSGSTPWAMRIVLLASEYEAAMATSDSARLHRCMQLVINGISVTASWMHCKA